MDDTKTIPVERSKHNMALSPGDTQTQDIGIDGMTCDNCVRTVEKALRSQPGVKEVKVDRAKARATVTFDVTRTDVPALHDAILKAGYKPARIEVE